MPETAVAPEQPITLSRTWQFVTELSHILRYSLP
jgi:hypothetical protein